MMDCCILSYPTLYKVVKISSNLNATAGKYNININSSVKLIQKQHK